MFKLRLIGLSLLLLAGCSVQHQNSGKKVPPPAKQSGQVENKQQKTDQKQKQTPPQTENNQKNTDQQESEYSTNPNNIEVVAQPASIPVLVNKQNKLPDDYTPPDLVKTTIPFIGGALDMVKMMRKDAADAIAQLFAGAKQQGVSLLGVSAYRSHAYQVEIFNSYVKTDGYDKARTYSALPGTSEHETGLAIDVTGGDGKCAADNCFGGTPEAKWLQDHAAEYGFIIRYPDGKDAITGYQYEPWHLRYVGKDMAAKIMSSGSTLEEYYHAVPVNN